MTTSSQNNANESSEGFTVQSRKRRPPNNGSKQLPRTTTDRVGANNGRHSQRLDPAPSSTTPSSSSVEATATTSSDKSSALSPSAPATEASVATTAAEVAADTREKQDADSAPSSKVSSSLLDATVLDRLQAHQKRLIGRRRLRQRRGWMRPTQATLEDEQLQLAQDLAMVLYRASQVLMDRLVEYLSRLPSSSPDAASAKTRQPLTTLNHDQNGLTLPVLAAGWLSLALLLLEENHHEASHPLSFANHFGSNEEDMSMKARQSRRLRQMIKLRRLLERVQWLRLTHGPNPYFQPDTGSTTRQRAASSSTKSTASTAAAAWPPVDKQIPKDDKLEGFVRKLLFRNNNNNDDDDDPQQSITTAAVESWLLAYDAWQCRPKVNLQALFPNLRALWMEQVPPEWILLSASQNLQVLRLERCAIYKFQDFLLGGKTSGESVGAAATQTTVTTPTTRESKSILSSNSNNIHGDSSDSKEGDAKAAVTPAATLGDYSGDDPLRQPPFTSFVSNQEESSPTHVGSVPPRFPNLTHLKLVHCSLTELDNDGSSAAPGGNKTDSSRCLLAQHCPRLQYLCLAHNGLGNAVLAALGQLSHLRHLDLSFNAITSLAGAHLILGGVTRLVLSHNQLRTCNDGIDRLFALQELYLDHNQLRNLTAIRGLAKLPHLLRLTLASNPLLTMRILAKSPSSMVQTTSKTKHRRGSRRRNYTATNRVYVFDLFRQELQASQTVSLSASMRTWQQSLPTLDGRSISLSELQALRGRTFRQTLAPSTTTTMITPTRTTAEESVVLKSETKKNTKRTRLAHITDAPTCDLQSPPLATTRACGRRRGKRRVLRGVSAAPPDADRVAMMPAALEKEELTGGVEDDAPVGEGRVGFVTLSAEAAPPTSFVQLSSARSALRSNIQRRVKFTALDVLESLSGCLVQDDDGKEDDNNDVENSAEGEEEATKTLESVSDTVTTEPTSNVGLETAILIYDERGNFGGSKVAQGQTTPVDPIEEEPAAVLRSSSEAVGFEKVKGTKDAEEVRAETHTTTSTQAVRAGDSDTFNGDHSLAAKDEAEAVTHPDRNDERDQAQGTQSSESSLLSRSGISSFPVIATEPPVTPGRAKSPLKPPPSRQASLSSGPGSAKEASALAAAAPSVTSPPKRQIDATLAGSTSDLQSESLSVANSLQLSFDGSAFPEHVWQDDNKSLLSSIATPQLEESKKYDLAEQNSKFVGPHMYKQFLILENLDLYFRMFVFSQAIPAETALGPSPLLAFDESEDDWQNILQQYPRIQLLSVDRRIRDITYAERAPGVPKTEVVQEDFRRVWNEHVVPCGKPALRRLTPFRAARLGFHGELVWPSKKDNKTPEQLKPQVVTKHRQVIMCFSNAAMYIIIDHDAMTAKANYQNRKFPLPIPHHACFAEAVWPHALARHPFQMLRAITIGFGFQRLTLRFSNSTFPSPEDYTYVLLTCNKMQTIALLREIQNVASECKSNAGLATEDADAIKIENDDPHVLEAIGLVVAPDVVGTVLHYQILQQRWKHGDRGTVRRVCLVSDAKIFLLDEDYAGDGAEASSVNIATSLGDTVYHLVDSAALSQISLVQAAGDDPKAITLVIRPTSRLQRTHNWRLICRDREGAERLVEDVRKAIASNED